MSFYSIILSLPKVSEMPCQNGLFIGLCRPCCTIGALLLGFVYNQCLQFVRCYCLNLVSPDVNQKIEHLKDGIYVAVLKYSVTTVRR